MKTIIKKAAIPVLIMMIVCMACTNNDDTPPQWFGTWTLSYMTVDGKVPENFKPNTTVWEFQSNVIRIALLSEHNIIDLYSFGTWNETDDHLTLDFTHGDDQVAPGTGEYFAPTWLLMPRGQTIDLEIIKYDKRLRQFRYTNPEGSVIEYTINKTW